MHPIVNIGNFETSRKEPPTIMHRKKFLDKKIMLIALCVILVAAYAMVGPEISVESLLSYTPKNLFAAAAVLLALYVFKSVVFVVPFVPLQLTAGHIFDPVTAIIVNAAGAAICLAVPYWFGCFAGGKLADSLVAKYPKFEQVVAMQKSSSFFLCFFLRAVGVLPAGVVTMYLGATKVSFAHNIIGGLLGMAPAMVLTTVLESGIKNPASPEFWLLAAVMVIFSVGTSLAYKPYQNWAAKRASNACA